ncbi:MAG: hypothetical protein U9N84_07870 [Actinomycetota bacterium]|nr:hypothetical protein [Actinomycetota bacterium]
MIGWLERDKRGDIAHDGSHLVFVFGWDLDVLDGATFCADDVMMMTRQPLGELVSGESFGSKVWRNDTSVLENRQ